MFMGEDFEKLDSLIKNAMIEKFGIADERVFYIEIAGKDFVARIKRSESETDGEFTLVTLIEVNLQT